MAGGPVTNVLLHQFSLLGADPESAVKMKSPVFSDPFSETKVPKYNQGRTANFVLEKVFES